MLLQSTDVTLIAKTYWGGMPFHFRRPPSGALLESRVFRAEDFRQFRGLYWAPAANPKPRVSVVIMHPRVDFTHHYAIPRLIEAGFSVLAANTRHPNDDTDTVHEEIVLDVAAAIRWLREHRGAKQVVLLGNSGGASLFGLYQAQAELDGAARIATTPAGDATRLPTATMIPADAMIYISAHRGEGKILEQCIDPSVTDELDGLSVDPALDMYSPDNGFVAPPGWSEYDEAFVARYRAAQRDRIARIDAIARAQLAASAEANREAEAEGFAARPFAERQAVLRRRHNQPVMVVYRTMANLHYVARHLDPSPRDYGSLLSDQPNLMNYTALGFARTVTARAWLSTWSANGSNADLLANVGRISAPTLAVFAGRDREIYPLTDAAPIFAAVAANDKTFVELPDARHYFEPEFGQSEAPAVEALMDRVVAWIRERTS
jgi:alpha-beta hydrolase superfamily lysophospholipase